jgi:hypothetical protein
MKRNLAAAMGRWRWKAILGLALVCALVGGAYGWENLKQGRMTGGGNFTCGDLKVTHGFELHCDASPPNNLEVNWGGNHFHLEMLTSAECVDDPNISPPPPAAPFDTFIGEGTGKFNGVDGATITFTLTDAGEPGTSDTITVTIKDSSGATVLACPTATLDGGNHQAHRNTP